LVIFVDVVEHCNRRVGIQGQGPKVRIFDTLAQRRVINQAKVEVEPKFVPILRVAYPMLNKKVEC
jgi:hypothetical protein